MLNQVWSITSWQFLKNGDSSSRNLFHSHRPLSISISISSGISSFSESTHTLPSRSWKRSVGEGVACWSSNISEGAANDLAVRPFLWFHRILKAGFLRFGTDTVWSLDTVVNFIVLLEVIIMIGHPRLDIRLGCWIKFSSRWPERVTRCYEASFAL